MIMTALERGIAFLYEARLEQLGIKADVTCQVILREPEEVNAPEQDRPAS